jgi:amidase
MTFLSVDMVERTAAELGFPLESRELRAYQDALAALIAEMESLDEERGTKPPIWGYLQDRKISVRANGDPLNCFITRCFVKGAESGILARRRVGLKDNVSFAGIPMTVGSRFMAEFVPDVDATLVTRLLDSGADIIGKLNMDNFSRIAHGFGTGVGDYGRVLNPCIPEHLSGGSSSGSAAAVASGAVDIAIGGDQGGSIRIPAAWCGVVGMKPTFGLVPHTGVVGIEWSLDHVGPLARRVQDIALALECIAGADGIDLRQMNVPQQRAEYSKELRSGLEGLRIGVLDEGFGHEGSEPDVEGAVLNAVEVLKRSGASIRRVSVPEHHHCAKLLAPLTTVGTFLAFRAYGCADNASRLMDTGLITHFERFWQDRARLLPPPVKLLILFGASLGYKAMRYYAKAQNLRHAYRDAYDRVFQQVDCIVMPTVPIKAPLYSAPDTLEEALERALFRRLARVSNRNTGPFNVTGHPAISVPCAISRGLPVGMMLVGRHFSEGLLLRVAYAFQESVDWDAICDQRPGMSE